MIYYHWKLVVTAVLGYGGAVTVSEEQNASLYITF